MQLTLKYNEQAAHVLNGAFIRGNTPGDWLQEINAWQLPLEKLVCFIIARDNNPANAAGLFVIFSKDQTPGLLQVRHPYRVLSKKLFIPVDAELWPAVSEQELQSLLIWDYQVFHPTIGFIGFEKSDRINLFELLQYKEPRTIYWGYAQPGLQPWTPLHQIGVQQLTVQEVFDSFKEHISNKPLTDIPKPNEGEVPSWLNNPIAGGLFKGLFKLISGLSSIQPEGTPGATTGNESGNIGRASAGDKKPGLFRKIINWMEQKIEDLEKQRDSELKRLSDMFDKDVDEALQYAIPLNSNYMGRGTAPPSGQLGKRSTQFNLGGLGGGRAIDGWNVDNYYDDLRTKYGKAAQKAFEQKDFKKAAYIYAHLLGDFTTAADVLRRGKYFRDAAVLYKEHLKNLAMAAICYEEGGLLMEAIEIYTELNQHEKAGDLYMELGQREPALNCYEKCVLAAAANKDYLEESRLIIDKIGDKQRAKKVLLNGWHDVKQPEACLMKYFDLVAENEEEQMHAVVKTFYSDNQVANKEMAFLNVIDKVNKKYKTTELENACQGIAYEIVSEQISAGNPDSLFTLRRFVPDDKLLTPDFYRFLHTVKEAPKQKPALDQWQLMSDVHWKKTVAMHSQLLFFGVKPTCVVMARMNWAGHIEHFIWYEKLSSDAPFLILADPENTSIILVYAGDVLLTEKLLPRNEHFKYELNVSSPEYLPPSVVSIGLDYGNVYVLHRGVNDAEINMSRFALYGEKTAGHPCTFKNGFGFPSDVASEMVACGEYGSSLVVNGHLLMRIVRMETIEILYQAPAPINAIAALEYDHERTYVVIAFDDKVVVLSQKDGEEFWDDPYQLAEIEVRNMVFLPNDQLVLAARQQIQVHNLLADHRPELIWQRNMESEVAAVFPGPNRDQLGILESNGRITLHKMP